MLKIFIDFDGTITIGDVGNSIFSHFAGEKFELFNYEYINGKISAIEYYNKLIHATKIFSCDEFISFIQSHEIDSTFLDFLIFCEHVNQNENKIEIIVLSDGFDLYLDRILKKYNIKSLKYFSNHLEMDDECSLIASFPYTDEDCKKCACCKRNQVLTLSSDEDIIVYIGDGYSDRCAVNYADIVFAKGSLQTYCQEQNISYYLYSNFIDVIERLKEILQRKRIRKRQQAEFNRKEIFTSG